jgi:hypothetical protein
VAVIRGGPDDDEAVPDRVTVRRASNPADPTGLGIAIARCLDAFGAPPTVCFDSLTVLLQYVETGGVFRFLHTMPRYLASVDAGVHAHLDPAAVDDRTVTSHSSLSDASLAHNSAGEVPTGTRRGGARPAPADGGPERPNRRVLAARRPGTLYEPRAVPHRRHRRRHVRAAVRER